MSLFSRLGGLAEAGQCLELLREVASENRSAVLQVAESLMGLERKLGISAPTGEARLKLTQITGSSPHGAGLALLLNNGSPLVSLVTTVSPQKWLSFADLPDLSPVGIAAHHLGKDGSIREALYLREAPSAADTSLMEGGLQFVREDPQRGRARLRRSAPAHSEAPSPGVTLETPIGQVLLRAMATQGGDQKFLLRLYNVFFKTGVTYCAEALQMVKGLRNRIQGVGGMALEALTRTLNAEKFPDADLTSWNRPELPPALIYRTLASVILEGIGSGRTLEEALPLRLRRASPLMSRMISLLTQNFSTTMLYDFLTMNTPGRLAFFEGQKDRMVLIQTVCEVLWLNGIPFKALQA